MATNTITRSYPPEDFAALVGWPPTVAQFEQLRAQLTALALSVPLVDVRFAPRKSGALVEFSAPPTSQDYGAVDGAIAGFAPSATTAAPLVAEQSGIASATVQDAVVEVLDVTTPPRDAGTYQALMTCMVGMLATVANAGVRGSLTYQLIRGAAVAAERPYSHGWNQQEPQTFSAPITFECQAGDRIRARLTLTKLGAPAATAQLARARITIDQLAPAE